MNEPITGRVASVASDRELIINRGAQHGVTEGMYFQVKGSPADVVDPESGEVIGTISKVKVIVRVDEVADKFCIARTFRTRRVNVGGRSTLGAGLSDILQPPRWETRVETLRRDKLADAPISERESIVAVGDPVESTNEEDLDAITMAAWK